MTHIHHAADSFGPVSDGTQSAGWTPALNLCFSHRMKDKEVMYKPTARHTSIMNVRVKREGERAKAVEKGGQAVERDPDRTDNASAKKEHLQ